MDKLIVKFKKLHPNAKIPTKRDGDAGFDLYTPFPFELKPMEKRDIPIGISIELPYGYYARIAPKSSISKNYSIIVHAGVSDPSYRGEIQVILQNLSFDLNYIFGK